MLPGPPRFACSRSHTDLSRQGYRFRGCGASPTLRGPRCRPCANSDHPSPLPSRNWQYHLMASPHGLAMHSPAQSCNTCAMPGLECCRDVCLGRCDWVGTVDGKLWRSKSGDARVACVPSRPGSSVPPCPFPAYCHPTPWRPAVGGQSLLWASRTREGGCKTSMHEMTLAGTRPPRLAACEPPAPPNICLRSASVRAHLQNMPEPSSVRFDTFSKPNSARATFSHRGVWAPRTLVSETALRAADAGGNDGRSGLTS